MTRKRVKFSRISKHKKKDKSKTVDIDGQQNTEINKTPDPPHLLDVPVQKCVKTKQKTAKQVHIAFLPAKYEPLVEDETDDKAREEKKKQDRYKKFRKNVGKALRYTWKCLVVGLQDISMGYSMPVSAVVPEIYRARAHYV